MFHPLDKVRQLYEVARRFLQQTYIFTKEIDYFTHTLNQSGFFREHRLNGFGDFFESDAWST